MSRHAADHHQARELRDMIYDEIVADDRIVETPINTDKSKGTCDCGFCDSSLRLYARHLPITNLLLVNKHFKAEYETRVAHAATLVVRDHVLSDYPDDFKPCFRGINLSMRNLHLDLTLECNHDTLAQNDREVVSEINMHRSWIDQLLPRLPNLRAITTDVRLHTPSHNFGCGQVIARNCAAFTSMPRLRALNVYLTDYGCGIDTWDYATAGTHTMTWDSRARELRNIDTAQARNLASPLLEQQQQQQQQQQQEIVRYKLAFPQEKEP
nr:hypothetical protein CFP56_66145 [Quercus suber]